MFLFLLLSVASARIVRHGDVATRVDTDGPSLRASNGCVSIHRWTNFTVEVKEKEFCVKQCSKVCQKKQQEVCLPVTTTTCVAKAWEECTSIPTTKTVRNDRTLNTNFPTKECQPGQPQFLTEIKKMAVCTNATKEMCDSKWVVNDVTLEKVWAGKANCRNVTWQNCELQDVPMVEEVPSFDCTDGEVYKFIKHEEHQEEVTTYVTTCKPQVVPDCKSSVSEACMTVEWEECSDAVEVVCNKLNFNEPHQEEQHTLRCPIGHHRK